MEEEIDFSKAELRFPYEIVLYRTLTHTPKKIASYGIWPGMHYSLFRWIKLALKIRKDWMHYRKGYYSIPHKWGNK